MKSAMSNSLVMRAILFLFLLNVISVKSEEVITSISGRKIPIHLIQEHFERKLTPLDDLKNIIYELTDEHVLQGHDLNIELRSDVQEKDLSTPPTVMLNGHMRGTVSRKLKTLKAKSYSIIVEDESGEILSVTGKGIVLSPIHRTQLPGVFVNKEAFSNPHPDFTNDIQSIDREQDGVSIAPRTNLEFQANTSVRQTRGPCERGTTHYLEIAVAYDNTFCDLFNGVESVATQAVQGLVDDSNQAFGRDTCIELFLSHVEAHCNDRNDPYRNLRQLSGGNILDGFSDFWTESRGNVRRDAAYLLIGFSTDALGVAFISGACSPQFGYAWNEGPRDYVFAHEVGHLVGGLHSRGGIMRALGRPRFRFAPVSVQQFTNFVDNEGGSSCMSTTNPSTGTCSSGFTRNRAFACRSRRLRRIPFTVADSPVGSVIVDLQQRNGQFIIRYRATNQLFLMRFRDLVTTNRNFIGGELRDYENLTGRARRASSRWDVGSQPNLGRETCCNRSVFIDSEFQVCVNANGGPACSNFRTSFRSRIECTNICRGRPGLFIPSSFIRACPSCI